MKLIIKDASSGLTLFHLQWQCVAKLTLFTEKSVVFFFDCKHKIRLRKNPWCVSDWTSTINGDPHLMHYTRPRPSLQMLMLHETDSVYYP